MSWFQQIAFFAVTALASTKIGNQYNKCRILML